MSLPQRKKKQKLQTGPRVVDDASYVCDACGDEIVIPVDISAGSDQRYVEDCPVCCNPNIVTICVDENGEVRCSAEPE